MPYLSSYLCGKYFSTKIFTVLQWIIKTFKHSIFSKQNGRWHQICVILMIYTLFLSDFVVRTHFIRRCFWAEEQNWRTLAFFGCMPPVFFFILFSLQEAAVQTKVQQAKACKNGPSYRLSLNTHCDTRILGSSYRKPCHKQQWFIGY